MGARLGPRVWAVTLGLVGVAALGVLALLATGAPTLYVGAGVVFLAYLSVVAWRSGGGYQFADMDYRPLGPRDPPEIRRALLTVCERAGRPLPDVVVVEMDVPGAMVGYRDGKAILAVDPRLLWIVGPEGLEAIFAHELGHLGGDLHTDAVRQYLPPTIGYAVCWTLLLAGQGPLVATAGTVVYLGLVPASHPAALAVRGVLSLGTELLALAASRYANRREEFHADEYAAGLVSPTAITEALYRIAAIATGDNDEDVTGPVPWNADRSPVFSLFATHPSIESRAAALKCDLPDWVRPYRPHATD